MNQSNRMIRRGLALAVAMVFAGGFPLFTAAAATFQNGSAAEMSDEKLEAVARAYIEVYQINQSYKAKIEAARTSDEANELQQAANQEMKNVIEKAENVTVSEYNDVISALGDDDELRERLQAHVDAIQEEESERD